MATTQQQRQELNKTYMNGKKVNSFKLIDVNTVKMAIFPRTDLHIWSSTYQYPSCLFFLQKLNQILNSHEGTNTQITLKKNDKTSVSTSQFRNLKTMVMKTLWYRHKHTKINGWDEIKTQKQTITFMINWSLKRLPKIIHGEKKSF